MCRAVPCPSCSKATWIGCGLHIDAALSGVSKEDRCSEWRTGDDCGLKAKPVDTKPVVKKSVNLAAEKISRTLEKVKAEAAKSKKALETKVEQQGEKIELLEGEVRDLKETESTNFTWLHVAVAAGLSSAFTFVVLRFSRK